MSSKDLPGGQVLGAGDDDHRRAGMIIKADGMLAHFAAYPADPFTCPDDEPAGLLPVLTVAGSRPRHDPRGLFVTTADLSS
jgi:hypothetical protein